MARAYTSTIQRTKELENGVREALEKNPHIKNSEISKLLGSTDLTIRKIRKRLGLPPSLNGPHIGCGIDPLWVAISPDAPKDIDPVKQQWWQQEFQRRCNEIREQHYKLMRHQTA